MQKGILFLLFLLPFTLLGQSSDSTAVRAEIDSLDVQFKQLMKAREFTQAEIVIDSIIEKVLAIYGTDHHLYGNNVYLKGLTLYYRGQYPKTKPLWLKARNIMEISK